MRREHEELYELAVAQIRQAAGTMGLVLPEVGPPQHQLAPVLERYLWYCGVLVLGEIGCADISGERGKKYPRLTLSLADVSPQARAAMERLTIGVSEDGPVMVSMDEPQESFRANRTRVFFRSKQPLAA